MKEKLKKINKKLVFRIVAVILVLMAINWYVNRDGLQIVPVTAVKLEDRVIERSITSSGEIKTRRDVSLSFNSVGRVYSINVEKGDKVLDGDLLAQLDASSVYQTAQAYKDARDIALRDRDLFIENYESKQFAYGGQDEYAIKLRQLDEVVSQAEATYQSRLYSLRDAYIYAPFDGTVVSLDKVEGETSMVSEQVVRLADTDNLYFEINLDQEDLGQVKVGSQAKITLDSYPDTIFEGEITELPFFAEGAVTPNFVVEISLKTDQTVKPLLGMTGDAEIIVVKSDTPLKSVLYDEIFYDEQDNPYLWVIDNGYILKQPVETGIEGDLYTEILTPIDKTVVLPINEDQEVKEGYKAKLINQ